MPKFFAFGERDAFGFPEAMQSIYRRAKEPKILHTCKSATHGSDLLYGACGEDIYQQMLSFLKEIN